MYLWRITILALCATRISCEYLMGGYLDNSESSKRLVEDTDSFAGSLARTSPLDELELDLDAEESTVVSSSASLEDGPRYALPFSFAFNGGRPFSLEKDPITGKIDFDKTPLVKASNYTDRTREQEEDNEENRKGIDSGSTGNAGNAGNGDDDVDEELGEENLRSSERETDDVAPNEINPYSPNFHDFLNLPVQYTSDKYSKDAYPLISSSYANTKIQSGSHSYSTYNHKPYDRDTTVYYPTRKPYVPKTTSQNATTATANVTTVPARNMENSSETTTTLRPPTSTMSSENLKFSTMKSRPTETSSTTVKHVEAPVITTWKPTVTTSFKRIQQEYDDDEEDDDGMLPIERLQGSIYNAHQGPNIVRDFLPSRHDTPAKSDMTQEEYAAEGYEDYENPEIPESEEHDYSSTRDPGREPPKSSTPTTSSTAPPETTVSTTEATTSSTFFPSISRTSTPFVENRPIMHSESVFSANPLQLQILPHRPITSMPLDDERREPPPFENTIDTRRPGIVESNPLHPAYGVPPISHAQRPGGIVIESTSNIVVPPGQDTVSFVLGNRQNVQDGYYSPGSAIGERPYGGSNGIDPTRFSSLYNVGTSGSTIQNNYEPPKNYEADRRIALPSVAVVEPNFGYAPGGQVRPMQQSHSIPQNRWPLTVAALKSSNEIEPAKTAAFPSKDTTIDGKDEKTRDGTSNGYVVFPSGEGNDERVEEHVLVLHEADGNVREVMPVSSASGTVTTLSTSSTTTKPRIDASAVSIDEDGLPQLSEKLTPPAERPRPPSPYYYNYQHTGTSRPEYAKPSRLPLPPRGTPPSSSHLPHPETMLNRRRPYSPDSKLPNILPQFRPNAKTSHGHRGSETIGTIPAGQPFSTRIRQPPPPAGHVPSRQPSSSRRPFPPPPSHLQRLNPPPPPMHALRLVASSSGILENVLSPQETDSPPKRFRLPPPVTSRVSNEDEKRIARLPMQKSNIRPEEEERHERYSEEPSAVPPRPPLFPKRRTADPPRVTTLQMIQQRGEPDDDASANFSRGDGAANEDRGDGIRQNAEHWNAERRKDDIHETIPESPVYVVYPVNTAVNIHSDDFRDKDESVVVGTRGPHRPLPPETLLQDEEYSERPSANDGTTAYDERPSDLPYEKPEPTIFGSGTRETPLLIPRDQRPDERDSGKNDRNATEEENDGDKDVDGNTNANANVIPYLQDFVPFPARKNGGGSSGAISATLHRNPSVLPSSTPIAYVYTPTAQASHRHDEDVAREEEDFSREKNEKPILLPSQQPSSSSSSAPSPQNFMAPFVASVSAEAPTKNGWNVIVMEPTIDRSSSLSSDETNDDNDRTSDSEDGQTEKPEFDIENFKPQLFGGFKPIYEFPTDDQIRRDPQKDASDETQLRRQARQAIAVYGKA